MGTEPRRARWPAHLPAGALRVVRWSARYEETVTFYRDAIGLPVLETFQARSALEVLISRTDPVSASGIAACG
jgi:hypothetical protein